jgi:hypothetical protein
MNQQQFIALYRAHAKGTTYASHMPDAIAYAWALNESGLRHDDVSSLNERGYFQVGHEWARDHGWTEAYFSGLSASPEASLAGSVRYAEISAAHVDHVLMAKAPHLRYGDSLWYMVKLYHGLPLLHNEVIGHGLDLRSTADVVAAAKSLASQGAGSPLDARGRGGRDWRQAVDRILNLTGRVVPVTSGTGGTSTSVARTTDALNNLLAVEDKVT